MLMCVDDRNREKISKAYRDAFSPLMDIGEIESSKGQTIRLAASSILSIWTLSQVALGNAAPKSFQEAENWFLGKRFPPNLPHMTELCDSWPPKKSLEVLSNLRYDADFVDVFPYVVEVFETLTVHRPRGHVPAKRRLGLYYTPSDVAEYVVQDVLVPWKTRMTTRTHAVERNCLDPACGSGVFLRAFLDKCLGKASHEHEQESKLNAVRFIYGMDSSPQAIQSCTFTLLLDCMDDVLVRRLDPWCAWQAIRGNLAVVDSTELLGQGVTDSGSAARRLKSRLYVRDELLNTNQSEPSSIGISSEARHSGPLMHANPILIGDVFPERSEACSVIVGTPPYSKAKHSDTQMTLSNWSEQVGKSVLAPAYLPFVEMMWRFADKRYARTGMVLPLSLACHSGKRFRALRRAIAMANGKWRFAFFDRTPDSLFGDDVKTRNSIALAEFPAVNKTIGTTSLMRWNSRNRKHLFDRTTYTDLGTMSIERLIPKIGSELELSVYKALRSRTEELGSLWNLPSHRLRTGARSCVFFRSTGYNWLPVFRSPPAAEASTVPVTGNSFHRLCFANPTDADFVFAVASSWMTYWLWRVEGDGFHLNESFLEGLPFHPSAFSENDLGRICDLSDALWKELQKYPVEKLNAAVLAVSYRPYECSAIIDDIDRILIETYKIPRDFFDALRHFVRETIRAGRNDSPRVSHALLQLKQ